MENKYSRPRGTQDLYFEESDKFSSLVNHIYKIANLYGYKNITTPIFEHKNLFVRSVGDSSDIVNKEFYDFVDKGGREISLRPEGTAGVIRAVIENKLLDKYSSPLKLCYFGPMFRYERPQSGRLREFHQFGVECVNANSYLIDAEIIILAHKIVNSLGLKNIKLSINNIGNFSSREKWLKDLTKYFNKYQDGLTIDSIKRINTNPLRILDDKIDSKKSFVINAPKIDKYLSNEEKQNFENILKVLDQNKIKYTIDHSIVRGLDYYTGAVFEINSSANVLKSQPTLVGGGRYNNLVAELGGKNVPCMGFAIGIERMLIALEDQGINLNNTKSIDVLVASLSENAKTFALNLCEQLRNNQISCICNFDTIKIKSHFNLASKLHAKYVIIIGDNEFKSNLLTIKNQKTMKEEKIKLKDLIKYLSK